MFLLKAIFKVCIFTTMNVMAITELPSYINVCSKNNPDLENCILANSEIIRPYLTKGIPELNLASIEPINIILINMDGNNIKATFGNIVVQNSSLYKLKSFKINFEKVTLDFEIELPLVAIVSDYQMEGHILVLQLKGDGTVITRIDNLKASFHLAGVKEVRNDKTYFKFNENFDVDVSVEKAHFTFNNLFGKNQVLTDATNNVINENWEVLFAELRTVTKTILGVIAIENIHRLFDTFSVDQLFPE